MQYIYKIPIAFGVRLYRTSIVNSMTCFILILSRAIIVA